MVVVLVVIARAALHAVVAEAVFRANGRAANIANHSNGCPACAHTQVFVARNARALMCAGCMGDQKSAPQGALA
jgi:hypothetical protein